MAHLDPEKLRARRRRVTLTLAQHRRDEHAARIHYDRTTGTVHTACVCELADTYFSKRSSHGCGCRKRTKGRPKVACGMCCIGQRDRIIHWRQEARALSTSVLAGRSFEEDEGRFPPTTKDDPKVFVVEKRGISRSGEPTCDWQVYRKYPSVKGRDNAILALRKNTPIFAIRGYRAGEAGVYVGPRYEYRVG